LSIVSVWFEPTVFVGLQGTHLRRYI